MKDYTIKNVKTHRGHDGDGFNCDLYENGKKIAHVHDDAWGGAYDYSETKGFDNVNHFNHEFDIIVSDLVQAFTRKKDEKKGVMIERGYGVEIRGFKTSIPNTIKKWEDGLEAIQNVYNEAIASGEVVLNKEYLTSVGVSV